MGGKSTYDKFTKRCDEMHGKGENYYTGPIMYPPVNPQSDHGVKMFRQPPNSFGYYSEQIQDDPPPLKSLPKDIQDFMESIEGMGKDETLWFINDYINNRIRYDKEEAARETSGQQKPGISTNYKDVLNSTTGDCDNYATAKIALLKQAGIPDENIMLVGGVYHYESGGVQRNLNHAAVIVEVDGEYWLLDSNFTEPVKLDENFKGRGIGINGEEVEITVDPWYVMPADNTNKAYVSNISPKEDPTPATAPRPAGPSV